MRVRDNYEEPLNIMDPLSDIPSERVHCGGGGGMGPGQPLGGNSRTKRLGGGTKTRAATGIFFARALATRQNKLV